MAAGLLAWTYLAENWATWLVALVGLAVGGLLYGVGLLAQGTPELRLGLSWLAQRLARQRSD
jgi:hypothetical protein